ncbi:unnamed protein product [Caenorhabditis angaria]|uniref:Amine oxidase domain-containing protein n=1 Tax=Caenorhabditis angaria TaxID=860376 RepID=A0A9P1IZQ9_9PELO|nr:unnamed protein product [Caenorhabditis angaria]
MLRLVLLIGFIFVNGEEVHVGIVGAGFAGLRAAKYFEDNGVRYTILEGSGRFGGRVYPFQYGDGFLQHGAEYVNGYDNEIYGIVKKYKLAADENSLPDDTPEFFVNGTLVPNNIIRTWQKFTDSLDLKLIQESESEPEKYGNLSILSRINFHFDNFVKNNTVVQRNIGIFRSLKDLYCNSYQIEWSSPIDQLAMENLNIWDDGKDVETVLNKYGFNTILQQYTSAIDKRNVVFNTKVMNVDYSSGKKVRVKTQNSTDYLFDFVIITSSLGYLKNNSISMFTPQLSLKKQNAIKNMGYGSNQKIFLEYSRPWWDPDSIIESASSSGNLLTLQQSSWASNILVAWIAGKNQLADLERVPDRIYKYSWIDDEFALGSYSFLKTGNGEDIIDQLALPIYRGKSPIICFAGEHTSPKMYQTTVGAIQSGLREAKRIVKLI